MSVFQKLILFISIGLFLCLAGCSPLVGQGQSRVAGDQADRLTVDMSVGQTFTARHAGLSGIEVYLAPGVPPAGGDVLLHLRRSSMEPVDLQSASLPSQQVERAAFYRFTFAPQDDSYLADYYLVFELRGAGALQVGTAPGDTYLEGALYLNGAAQDRQLAFQPLYSRAGLALGLLRQGLTWLGELFLALAVFLLPGWAVLSGLWAGWRTLNWGEKAGLASGLSLAAVPVVLLWANLVGLRLGAWFAWFLLALGVLCLAYQHRHWRFAAAWRKPIEVDWPLLGLAVVFILVFAIRFWMVRAIDFPMWGDSYQHTMMAQLILDRHGLFQSWAPYLPYTSLTVQYGFPAQAAIYAWISGAAAPQAVLWSGQVINALAIVALYPLMRRIAPRQRWAGVMVVLLAGLWMNVPAVYVNWGRYAQLSGQAILPAAIWLAWGAFTSPSFDVRKVLLAGLALTGMLLTYYRMAFYFGAFFAAWWLFWAWPGWRAAWQRWRAFGLAAAAVALTALILLLPWLRNVLGSSLAGSLEAGLTSASPLQVILQDYAIWRQVGNYVPLVLIGLAGVGLARGLWQREWSVAGIALWAALVAAIKAGQLINLPGANMMQSFAVVIFLYIPLGLLAGWGVGQAAAWLEARLGKAGGAVILLGVLAAALGGAYAMRDTANPAVFAYVTRPDQRAAAWIRRHTAADAAFLVEGYRIYDGTTAVGSDGGWWLPLSAGRSNSMPAQYALMNEQPAAVGYSQRVVDLIAVLESHPPNSPTGLAAICRMGLTHLYIGQGQGQVGIGARALYDRALLVKAAQFEEIYHQDRVSIFALRPGACESVQP